MASKKLKKFLKKAGKAALIGGALYAGTKLGRRGTPLGIPGGGVDAIVRRKAKRDAAIDAGIQSAEDDKGSDMYVPRKFKMPSPAIDQRVQYAGMRAEGGRISKKHGGRTGKQFGGGLNRPVAGPVAGPVARPVARPVGGVGAPVRPLAYKKGGRVKSMGIAKRGGGVAKR